MKKINEIKGFEHIEDYYYITTCGKVYSIFKKIFLKPYISNTGYLKLTLSSKDKETKRTKVSIHRLVALCYIENVDNLPTVNHINSDKRCNHINNLEWLTYSDNVKHYIVSSSNKTHKGQAKLKDEQVIEVYNRFHLKKDKLTHLANEFNVDFNVIKKIVTNKNYLWVKR